jgi:hypothetical protein
MYVAGSPSSYEYPFGFSDRCVPTRVRRMELGTVQGKEGEPQFVEKRDHKDSLTGTRNDNLAAPCPNDLCR